MVIWREGLDGHRRRLTATGALRSRCSPIRPISAPTHGGCPRSLRRHHRPIDPPRFEALARLRPRDANPVAYAGLYAAEQQRNAYPEIGPLEVAATPQAAYDAVLAVVTKRQWR